MNTAQRLLSNTALTYISSVFVKASNTVLFIFIGRLLGPAVAGTYNLGITYFTIMLALSGWGLHELLVRELAPRRQESGHYLSNYLVLRLILALLTYGLLILLLKTALPYTETTKMVIAVLSLAIFPEAIFMMFQALFAAHEKLLMPSLAAIINGIFKLLAGYWVLIRGGDALGLAWIMVFGGVIGAVVLIPSLIQLLRRTNLLSTRLSFLFMRHQLRLAPGFILISFFTAMDFQLDALIISFYLDETSLGYYGAAQIFVLGFLMMPAAFRTAIYPLMARYYHEDSQKLALLYHRTNRYILAAVFPVCISVMVMAPWLIMLLFGEAFQPAISALQVMIWTVIFAFLTVPNARLALVANRQSQAGWITGLSMTINLALNIWLIPRYGIVGAALGRTVTSFAFFAMMYIYVQRNLLTDGILPLLWRPLVASSVMIVVLWNLKTVSFFWAGAVSMVVYLVVIWLLGVIPREDRQYFRQLVKSSQV
ncbi:MAG: flippase [Anaerolineae bacterium]|nr:flippase [Anaerolineae bacterium]